MPSRPTFNTPAASEELVGLRWTIYVVEDVAAKNFVTKLVAN
jgi:hypothetical protein